MDTAALARRYFTAFERKDMASLVELFHPDVVLTDWENHLCGRDAVLAHNQKVFQSLQDIRVNLLHLHEAGATVIGEMEIILNGGAIQLKVVDVITFDERGAILSIRAYQG
ncbi:MAG: nuclear transport factor 2 family protein [Nitrospirae bacterium]|nr:nuclear transport factor 2 family protein [Magnetococcales bacterium]